LSKKILNVKEFNFMSKFVYKENLLNLLVDILLKIDVPTEKAKALAGNLVRSDLRGIRSHGLNNFSMYIKLIKNGVIKPYSNYKIVGETASTAFIDGNMDIGQYVCQEAAKIASKKARNNFIGIVGLKNIGHAGHISDYTRMILDENLIGIMYINTNSGVAPFGGKEPVLGTNPISYAIPAGKENSIIIDFATSATAVGYIRKRLRNGEKLEKGWVIKKDGFETTNPKELFEDTSFPIAWGDNFTGALLPAAGHKGYGLALAVDIFAGALTGGRCADDIRRGENFAYIQAINPEIFVSFEEYSKRVDKLIRKIKSSSPKPGVKGVLIPGDPERESEKEALKNGIEIEDKMWQELIGIGDEYGIDVNKYLK